MVSKKAKKSAPRTMVATEELSVSTIQITFEGMMMLFVSDKSVFCDVAILKHAPEHFLSILVTKIPDVGAPERIVHLHGDDFESRLWLDVQKRDPLIELFKDSSVEFKRDPDINDLRDFRWAVDFEGNEMYVNKIGVDNAGFRSILRINDGKFFTQEISDNILKIKRGTAGAEKPLGKVAVKLRADIHLVGSEKAFFSNGPKGVPVPLIQQPRINYGIYVSHIRDHNADPHTEDLPIDAENYNTAVAIDVAPNRKIHFNRDRRVTPDAACCTPTMSQSGSGF